MRQQGLLRAVAQASVTDEVVQSIELNPETIEELVEHYFAQHKVNTPQQRQSFLSRKGLNDADLLYLATKKHRLDLFKQHMFDPEVEIRFLERKLDLDQVIYSLIRVEQEHVAEELYQRILEGEDDFADLAERFSTGQERHTKGRIGPVALTQAHEEVSKRLRVSRAGQLHPPFHLVNIWVILRLEQWFPAELNQETRETLRNELFNDWFQQRVQRLLSGEELPPLSSPATAAP